MVRRNKTLTFERPGDIIRVTRVEGKYIGDLAPLNDGFWYYFPENLNGGCWSESYLLIIANKLIELNKPLQEDIDRYFGKEKQDVS